MDEVKIRVKKNRKNLLLTQIVISMVGLITYYLNFQADIYLVFFVIGATFYVFLIYNLFKMDRVSKRLLFSTFIVGYALIISMIMLTGKEKSIFIYGFPIGSMLLSYWYSKKVMLYSTLFNIVFVITLWARGDFAQESISHILPVILIMGCLLVIFFIQDKELEYFYKEEIIYHKDIITGLHNYRYFQKFVDSKIKEAQKSNFIFAIFLLDIANLQRINELVGYSAANRMLSRVASILEHYNCFSQLSFYSGGCFIGYAKVKNIKEASLKAKEVEQLIAGYPLLSKGSISTNVNINIGWAVYPFQGNTIGQLEVKANEKLNESKRLRRREELEYKNRIEKLTLIGQLAAGFAHEIKNPLTTVKGFCQLVKERPESEKNSDYMQIVIDELERVNSLLTDFLKLAKSHKPNLEKIKIEDFLNNVKKIVNPQIKLHDICFKVKVAPQTPEIFVDKEQMTQVFLNLIINAIDAVKDKKGEISINAYPKCDEGVLIEVSDNGIGIEEEKLNKIFEPFYSEKDHGTGLGLAISHKIVEAHDGDITVRSIKGKGTTFSLLFPAK